MLSDHIILFVLSKRTIQVSLLFIGQPLVKQQLRMSEAFLLVVGVVFLIVDFGLFCCSVVGNAVVIYVISRDKKLKSKSNYHILSVAVADFTIGLVGIPLGVTAVSFALFIKYLFIAVCCFRFQFDVCLLRG